MGSSLSVTYKLQQSKAVALNIRCSKCGARKTIPCGFGLQGAAIPTTCDKNGKLFEQRPVLRLVPDLLCAILLFPSGFAVLFLGL